MMYPQTATEWYLLTQMASTVLYGTGQTGPWTPLPRGCLEFLPFCTRISISLATREEFPQALKAKVLPPAHAEGSMGQHSLVGLEWLLEPPFFVPPF